ncbi:MAG: lipoate--protein ligase [Anaerolineaceae bacterium]
MKFIEWPETDAYFNLAAEEYVFSTLDKEQEYIMLWQNENAVVIGKHQNTLEEISTPYVEEHKIQIVRRLTGGGAVYHDLGNLNYTFILNVQQSEINFRAFSQPMADALNQLGLNVEFSGRNDLILDGKKISGVAQYIKSGRVLHHGTLLFNSNLNVLSNVLNVSNKKIESKGVKSVRSRVTNISDYLPGVTMDEFKKHLEKTFIDELKLERYEFTEKDIAAIKELRKTKYSTWEWNYGKSPEFDVRKEFRFSEGGVTIYIRVNTGIIQEIHLYGDFFGNGDISDIENRLQSVRLREEDVRDVLRTMNVGHYIFGMDAETLAKYITD